MTGASIRRMTREDLSAALSLINAEGWNYTTEELERMLRLDPDGSFIAEYREPVGIVTSVSYGRTGVIGHLVVSKQERGKRIGQALLREVVDYMDGSGTDAIVVYATSEGEALYMRHGFRRTRDVFCLNAYLPVRLANQDLRDVKNAGPHQFDEIMALDAAIFGDDRRELLGPLLDQFPDRTYVIERAGAVSGFVMARRGTIGFDLGPWECATGDPADAAALFAKEVSTFDKGLLFLGTFTENKRAMDIIGRLEPFRTYPLKLMVRGSLRYADRIEDNYGIAGFELG